MTEQREAQPSDRSFPNEPGDAILESIADGLFTLDREWRFTYVNRPAEFLLERDRDELLGRVIWEVFPDAVPPVERKELERVAEGRELAEFQEFHPSLGRWLEYRAYPSEEGLAVYFRDVTEAKQRQKTERFLHEVSEVLASSLEYAATLQRIADLSAGFLADYCIVHVEEGGKIRAPGIAHADPARAEIVRGLLRRFPVRPDQPHPVMRALRTGEPQLLSGITEETLREISAGPEHLEMLHDLGLSSVMVVPLQARGRTLGAIVLARTGAAPPYGPEELEVARELARRAALAVDNARLYEEMRQAMHARDEMLAVVSHDLRNPLHAVLIAASFLEEFPDTSAWSERDRRQVEVIRRSAEQMARLIQDLVEVISLESGPLPLERSPLDVAGVLDGVTSTFLPIAERKRVHLVAEAASGLPPVLADRGRLLQVFSNLVGNAVRFTPEGSVVALKAEREGPQVRFSVADTGPGIAPEHLPHLFDRFWQAKRGAGKGLGLGLAIAKGIVEAHGGRIWVESRVGAGSTFLFTLPTGE
jgi:PAS domain S-box-containing protein